VKFIISFFTFYKLTAAFECSPFAQNKPPPEEMAWEEMRGTLTSATGLEAVPRRGDGQLAPS
jgi:hypothetical protein